MNFRVLVYPKKLRLWVQPLHMFLAANFRDFFLAYKESRLVLELPTNQHQMGVGGQLRGGSNLAIGFK